MTGIPTEILIVVGVAAIVAIGIKLYRSRSAAQREVPHVHDSLMKRAEAHAGASPFLRKVCQEYKANGHISNRQAEAVAKAVARIEQRART